MFREGLQALRKENLGPGLGKGYMNLVCRYKENPSWTIFLEGRVSRAGNHGVRTTLGGG